MSMYEMTRKYRKMNLHRYEQMKMMQWHKCGAVYE